MNVISVSLFALACVAFVGGGYLRLFRWDVTPVPVRWGVWVLFAVLAAGAFCFRTPLLFGSDTCLQRWLRGKTHGGGRWAEIEGERRFQRAQGQVLGEYLKAQVKGGRCVILCAPALLNLDGNPVEDMTVAGLRQGLGDGFEAILELEVPMESASRLTEEGELKTGLPERPWTADALNRLLETAGRHELLIACVPLPEDCFGSDGEVLCAGLKGKAVALCAGAWGSARKAVSGGGVLAAVGYQPEAECREKTCPASPREAFSQRYVLMTPAGDVTFSDSETED